METLTTITLTPEDAQLFIQFQKRFAFMKLLDSMGAFDIRSGSLTVHFTNTGEIGSIDKHQHFRLPI